MRPGLAVAQLDVQHDSATMGYSILQETLSLIYFLPRKKLT
jgi:hypothetical protein